jgi:hypothetical protein
MTMPRSLYSHIAEAIGVAWAELPAGPVTETAMRKLIVTMADEFKARNNSFDRSLFLDTVTTVYLNERKPYRKRGK